MEPISEKLEKEAVFSVYCRYKTARYHDRAKKKHQPFSSRLCRQLYNLLKLFNCF